MTTPSNRSRKALLAVSCLWACGGLGALPANADVLEIGPAGPTWIAAGNALAQPAVQSAPPPEDASLTPVRPAAGPAAWSGHVAALSAKYDISAELLEAVVWQESRWNSRALSPAGARGLAQLMPGTARQLGVDPHDPRANLEGGARYLRMQLDRFDGNVEKALAAYNAGPGRVERAGGVPAIRETREYVASIMARLSQPVRR